MDFFKHTDDPCWHCGACFSFCEWDRFKRGNPGEAGGPELCRPCMYCYTICARVHPSEAFPSPGLFDGAIENPQIGRYRAIWSGTDPSRIPESQDGGVTTALLEVMLEEGMIDGAVVVGRDSEWNAVPRLARTIDEVRAVAGSKYTTAPGLAELSDALTGCERVAAVGVPCQVTAFRNMLKWKGNDYPADRFIAILGLFCFESFRYDATRELVEGQFGLPIERATRFDIKRNRFQVFDGDGTEPKANLHLSEARHLSWAVCHSCTDFSAELADVSLGAVGSKAGANTILVRTGRGQEIVDRAVASGRLQLEPVQNQGLVERISENKRKRREELTVEEARFLLKQTLRGNHHKMALKGEW